MTQHFAPVYFGRACFDPDRYTLDFQGRVGAFAMQLTVIKLTGAAFKIFEPADQFVAFSFQFSDTMQLEFQALGKTV